MSNPSKAFKHALLTERVASRFEKVSARAKQFIGNVGRTSYAIKIEGIDPSFLKRPFGRQLDDFDKIKEWKKSSKSTHVRAKGKATLAAVKRWVKDTRPKEFYAKWTADSSDWKNDSVEIFYK